MSKHIGTTTVGTTTVDAGPTGNAGPVADPARPAAPDAAGLALPIWFFCFEGVLAAAYDILKAFPQAWPALLVVVAVNITVSLTLMRRRLRLAKALWRGKGTRTVALGLVALRVGSHAVLGGIGLAVTSTAGHVAFGLVMAALAVGVLAFSQRTALRALGAL